ncbi:uncharacterized protein LOC116146527 isoform X1 [Pistacia vera]|uniref:uncharacterized protein LOC116146527 isoform X1 n=1 Tax=Pistacia vera TaxID=55513 RepID=UPI001262D146|nr:uncharacterized protein LOC116146527 isoform X1 [Pistacia vera]
MASLAFTSFMIHPLPLPLNFKTNTNTNNGFYCFPSCRRASSLEKFNFFSLSPLQKPSTSATASSDQHSQQHEDEEEDESFQVLTAIRSKYNDIVIVDTSTSRMLLLDHTNNVHSIFNKGLQKWTDSYWDEFSSLPAIVPKGPIAIYGLGGGTAAHLMLDLWPSLQLEGIIIDLFSEGKVLEQLQEPATWLKLKERLMPDGRFMVNCGGIGEASETSQPESEDDTWLQNSTIKALSESFPGEVCWKRMPKRNGENFLALTGPIPDLSLWSDNVPGPLSENVKQWKPCKPFP